MKHGLKKCRWVEGEVDTDEEHIELRYGNANESGWESWPKIALVSSPKFEVFTVQFLLAVKGVREQAIIDHVRRQLDFYLVEKREYDQWAYVQYHCGTMANVYSNVHWSFVPKACDRAHLKERQSMKAESNSWLWPHLKSILGQHEQTLSSWRNTIKHVPTHGGRVKNFETWLLVELVHKLLSSPDVEKVRTNGHFFGSSG